ncbi:BPSL0761 family protein [Arenimonas sp. SCN 70-307]|uniref:BPSL0761 family protein n=1 Tax=Arenimonas sp. SCN 70-307 TaxID=1660089 RepID=UPI0025C63129|nr:BPSL0761 family protein [Arenimonas sp. SCN 70-307]
MTTPDERRRTLVQAGAFLKELRRNDALPEQVRREAHRLLRHYPSLPEIDQLAKASAGAWGGSPLSAEHDPDWLRGYAHGAHHGG